jgi:hypothetical protein
MSWSGASVVWKLSHHQRLAIPLAQRRICKIHGILSREQFLSWYSNCFISFVLLDLNIQYLTFRKISEWNYWQHFLFDIYSMAMKLDESYHSHPVQVFIEKSRDIKEIFDSIRFPLLIFNSLNYFLKDFHLDWVRDHLFCVVMEKLRLHCEC